MICQHKSSTTIKKEKRIDQPKIILFLVIIFGIIIIILRLLYNYYRSEQMTQQSNSVIPWVLRTRILRMEERRCNPLVTILECPHYGLEILCSIKRDQGFLQKWLIQVLEWETHKMNQNIVTAHIGGRVSKASRVVDKSFGSHLEEAPWSKGKHSEP